MTNRNIYDKLSANWAIAMNHANAEMLSALENDDQRQQDICYGKQLMCSKFLNIIFELKETDERAGMIDKDVSYGSYDTIIH